MDSTIRRRSHTVWRQQKYIIYNIIIFVWRRENVGEARFDNRSVPSHTVIIDKLTSTLFRIRKISSGRVSTSAHARRSFRVAEPGGWFGGRSVWPLMDENRSHYTFPIFNRM